jgi:hypothetical protein
VGIIQEMLQKAEIQYISEFNDINQVEGYRILKQSEFNAIKEENRHTEKMTLLERLSKAIVKIASIVSTISGAAAVLIEIFLPF